MDNITAEIIAALIVGLLGGGGLVAWYHAPSLRRVKFAEARKIEAEEEKLAAESWVLLVRSLQERVDKLESQIKSRDAQIEILSCENKELKEEVAELREYMEKQGLTPPPRKGRTG